MSSGMLDDTGVLSLILKLQNNLLNFKIILNRTFVDAHVNVYKILELMGCLKRLWILSLEIRA